MGLEYNVTLAKEKLYYSEDCFFLYLMIIHNMTAGVHHGCMYFVINHFTVLDKPKYYILYFLLRVLCLLFVLNNFAVAP